MNNCLLCKWNNSPGVEAYCKVIGLCAFAPIKENNMKDKKIECENCGKEYKLLEGYSDRFCCKQCYIEYMERGNWLNEGC